MKFIKIITTTIFLLILGIFTEVSACSVAMTNDGKNILAGNNEDYNDLNTYIWYYPATEKEYGRVCLGYESTFAYTQGGMNDRGLFIDGNALGTVKNYQPDKNKPDLLEPEMEFILKTCKNVDEAIEVFKKYNVYGLSVAKFPIADAFGNSVVIEWGDGKLQALKRTGKYQISTNFVQSDYKKIEDYPCLRYKIADQILSSSSDMNVENMEKVLSATHQGTTMGLNSTLYSNICDLKNKIMYLYYFHFFEEPLKIDLAEELKKGKHGYKISDLFPIKPYSSITYEGLTQKSGRIELMKIINEKGVESAIAAIDELKSDYIIKITKFNVTEGEINTLGYDLMKENKLQDAIKVLSKNVQDYPDSWNVYDTLGEAYMKNGQKDEAIKNYEMSLKLNPENPYGIEAMKKLKE